MDLRFRVPALLVVSAALLPCAGCASEHSVADRHEAVPAAVKQVEPKEFSIEGHYAEACSCSTPCACELTGPDMSCKGVGAYQFDKGHYGDEDFSGCRMAYSLYIGESVRLYIDAPDAAKRTAMEHFARVALAGFGPITSVRAAKVELSGKDGAYTIKVDDGKVMTCTTEPLLGGDKKTPVVHSNTFDAMNPVMYQARCVSCTYEEGDMHIALKGTNSYFNAHMKASGKL